MVCALSMLVLSGCCLWRYVGVVYLGKPVKTTPSAASVAGSYRVSQYGGASVRAAWPKDLVLTVHEDGTLTCSGDASLFSKDFLVAQTLLDPNALGAWKLTSGREGFPVGIDLIVGGKTICGDLLRRGDRYGVGISQAYGGDPDDRDTLEFLQDPTTKASK